MTDQNVPETASSNTGMIVGIIAVLVIIAAAIYIYSSKGTEENYENSAMNVEVKTSEGTVNVTETNTVPETNTPAEPKKSGFSAEEVKEHNSVSSCYVIVGESVYDLTDWIAKHPGGADNITKLCGTDGTELFTKQHGTFQKAKDTLASYMISDLVK